MNDFTFCEIPLFGSLVYSILMLSNSLAKNAKSVEMIMKIETSKLVRIFMSQSRVNVCKLRDEHPNQGIFIIRGFHRRVYSPVRYLSEAIKSLFFQN